MSKARRYRVKMQVSVPVEMELFIDSCYTDQCVRLISQEIDHQTFNGVLTNEMYKAVMEHEEHEIYGYEVYLDTGNGLNPVWVRMPKLSRLMNQPATEAAIEACQITLNASGVIPGDKG